MNFLGNGFNNDPAYQVPVGCENQPESLEDASSNNPVQPYEITRVQPSDQGEGILECASKSPELGKESQY